MKTVGDNTWFYDSTSVVKAVRIYTMNSLGMVGRGGVGVGFFLLGFRFLFRFPTVFDRFLPGGTIRPPPSLDRVIAYIPWSYPYLDWAF